MRELAATVANRVLVSSKLNCFWWRNGMWEMEVRHALHLPALALWARGISIDHPASKLSS